MTMSLRSSAIRVLTLFVALGFPQTTSTYSHGNIEEIRGAVVAYDEIQATWIPFYYGTCEGSLIVRIDMLDEATPRYVRVDFKYRTGKFPKELIRSKREWRFRLERTSQRDEPLYEYVIQAASLYSAEKKYPIWKLVPGAEIEKLPFEKKVPSYSMAKGGFKLFRKGQ